MRRLGDTEFLQISHGINSCLIVKFIRAAILFYVSGVAYVANTTALMVGSLQSGLSMQLLVDPTMNLDPIRKTSLATLRINFEP
ncbi:hypothetical protein ABIB68_008181 [Bradyrhizobium sp. F1.2.2]